MTTELIIGIIATLATLLAVKTGNKAIISELSQRLAVSDSLVATIDLPTHEQNIVIKEKIIIPRTLKAEFDVDKRMPLKEVDRRVVIALTEEIVKVGAVTVETKEHPDPFHAPYLNVVRAKVDVCVY